MTCAARRTRATTSVRSIAGFSLIELMISLVISLVIVAAVGYVYVGNRNAFRTQTADSRLTDNSRIAIEYLTKDLRHAARLGCTRPESAKAHGGVALTAVLPVMFGSQTQVERMLQPNFTPPVRLVEPGWLIRGFGNGSGFVGPPAARRANTDVLQIIKTGENSTQLGARMAGADSNPSLASVLPDAVANSGTQLFVITDCDRAEIVRGAVESGGAAGGVLNINAPGWNQLNRVTKAYDIDATVSRFDPAIYMVVNPAASDSVNSSQLVRFSISPSGLWNPTPQVIADGIEDFQIRFGVASAGFGTNSPDRYMFSSEINGSSDPSEIWRQVRSVEITLVVISEQSNVATNATARVNQAGTDTRLRQRIVQVVSLRNQIL
jgi:type IV pilus assembly protein PilW